MSRASTISTSGECSVDRVGQVRGVERGRPEEEQLADLAHLGERVPHLPVADEGPLGVTRSGLRCPLPRGERGAGLGRLLLDGVVAQARRPRGRERRAPRPGRARAGSCRRRPTWRGGTGSPRHHRLAQLRHRRRGRSRAEPAVDAEELPRVDVGRDDEQVLELGLPGAARDRRAAGRTPTAPTGGGRAGRCRAAPTAPGSGAPGPACASAAGRPPRSRRRRRGPRRRRRPAPSSCGAASRSSSSSPWATSAARSASLVPKWRTTVDSDTSALAATRRMESESKSSVAMISPAASRICRSVVGRSGHGHTVSTRCST